MIDLGELAGDLVVRHTSASLKVEHVSGDASVRDVDGAINFADIGGDLHLRNPQDNLKAVVAGDVIASISPQPDAAYQIDAGADIVLRLPVEADVEMTLSSGSDLDVHIPGVEESEASSRSLTLGSGSAKMNITADGDILVTTRSSDWADLADFDISLPFIGADFPGLSDDFAEDIARKAEEAARKVEEKMRSSEYKFAAAARRAPCQTS